MSSSPTLLTLAEYVAAENAAEFRSEYCAGVTHPVFPEQFAGGAGASWAHSVLKENLIGELGMRFKGGPWRTLSSTQRVHLPATDMIAYPDILLLHGKAETSPADPWAITNPQAIIEVLSPSTERYDRGFKFAQYRRQPTIREVLFVAQDTMRIERFVRQTDDSWLWTEFTDPAGDLELATVPVRVPLADVYRGVALPPGGATGR